MLIVLIGRYGHISGRHGEGIGTASVVCQGYGVARTIDSAVGRTTGQGQRNILTGDKVFDTSVLQVFSRRRRHVYATGTDNLVSTCHTVMICSVNGKAAWYG